MKRLITTVTILILLLTAGCVSAKYNPRTGEVSYKRFGNQAIRFRVDANSVELEQGSHTTVKVVVPGLGEGTVE